MVVIGVGGGGGFAVDSTGSDCVEGSMDISGGLPEGSVTGACVCVVGAGTGSKIIVPPLSSVKVTGVRVEVGGDGTLGGPPGIVGGPAGAVIVAIVPSPSVVVLIITGAGAVIVAIVPSSSVVVLIMGLG